MRAAQDAFCCFFIISQSIIIRFFSWNPLTITIFLVFITIDGVRRLITTTIELTNDDRCRTTRILLDVQFNATIQPTTRLITAKYTFELTTGQCQTDVTTHVGILSTGIDSTNPVIRHTTQNNLSSTKHIGLLTTAINFLNLQVITTAFTSMFLVRHRSTTKDITLIVTTTIHIMDITAREVRLRCTHGLVICFIVTNVSRTNCTITTTKHIVNNVTAINHHLISRCSSSITATKHILDTGLFTTINDYFRIFSC